MRTTYLNILPDHWQPVAAVFAAMGDTTRQRILLLFEPGEELSIKDIAAIFDFGRSTIVHHLAVLEKAGILSVRREGRQALYSVCHDIVLDSLENCASSLKRICKKPPRYPKLQREQIHEPVVRNSSGS